LNTGCRQQQGNFEYQYRNLARKVKQNKLPVFLNVQLVSIIKENLLNRQVKIKKNF